MQSYKLHISYICLFKALFAFKLYNDGIIGLDDPLVKYEPDFRVKNPYKNDLGRQITIR
jgi:CubicO group peptidase (beta-lactamase class C family)